MVLLHTKRLCFYHTSRRKANSILAGRFKLITTSPSCCFECKYKPSVEAEPTTFVWDPPNDENNSTNVERVRSCACGIVTVYICSQMLLFGGTLQVVKYLEEHVLPKGMHVVPLQGLEWLTTCIDCLASGSVTVNNSKTDYVLLTEEGWQMLQVLKAEHGNVVTASMLHRLLPEVVALLETKTSKSLSTGSPDGPVHQAVLEYLAVNDLARRTGGCIAA